MTLVYNFRYEEKNSKLKEKKRNVRQGSSDTRKKIDMSMKPRAGSLKQ